MQTVTVRESGKGRFAQEITIGKHVLVADEPVASGGDDTGATPYDFILAGLGACTSMTIRMYANLKKIPVETITVSLTHEKIYAQDCADCEKATAKIDHIDRKIELTGSLTVEQRAKLLDIANKCPVHRTLLSKISITTEMV